MGLKRLKLEIAILQVVFNGHAFSRYHHEVFVGIGANDAKSSSLSLTSYPEFGFSVPVSLLLTIAVTNQIFPRPQFFF